jgi:hypothetical protein
MSRFAAAVVRLAESAAIHLELLEILSVLAEIHEAVRARCGRAALGMGALSTLHHSVCRNAMSLCTRQQEEHVSPSPCLSPCLSPSAAPFGTLLWQRVLEETSFSSLHSIGEDSLTALLAHLAHPTSEVRTGVLRGLLRFLEAEGPSPPGRGTLLVEGGVERLCLQLLDRCREDKEQEPPVLHLTLAALRR